MSTSSQMTLTAPAPNVLARAPLPSALAPMPESLGEVLTMRLGQEDYAVDILCVQEIRSYEPPTRLVGAPAHVLGIINLRGLILPVIDLRSRLGMDACFDPHTATVVLNVQGRTVGVVVDAVSDVVLLASSQLHRPPGLGSATASEHIAGIATLGAPGAGRTLILLNAAVLITDLA